MFKKGKIVVTCGVNEAICESEQFSKDVLRSFVRYSCCDWGEMCNEDIETNNYALKNGGRIFASYETCKGKIWIITEWDRSVTTVLFPSEY